MFDETRRLLSNPLALVQWVLDNPRTAALIVVAGVLLVVLAVLSFGLGLVPDWTLLFGIAFVAAWLASRYWHRIRLLWRATSVAAGSLSPGTVEVSGRVQPASENSRVTHDGEEYIAYRYRKVRRKTGSDGRTRVETDESRAVPFYVQDDTGSVPVDPTNPDLELEWDRETDEAGYAKSYLATLHPGDEVRVYGTAMHPDERGPRNVRDAATEGFDKLRNQDTASVADSGTLVVSKGESLPALVITDRPGWRLLARSVALFLGTLAVTLGLIGFGTALAVGVV